MPSINPGKPTQAQPQPDGRRLQIAVDARPLAHPYTGIGQYLSNLLDHLIPASRHRWFLYADEPFDIHTEWTTAVIRCGRSSRRVVNTLSAQTTFGRWAKADRCDVFWGPRHQLPLSLPARLPGVLTIHDLVWRTHPQTMTRLGRLADRCTMPRALHRANAILTTSGAVQKELAACYPPTAARLHVVPLASAIDRHGPQPRELPEPYFVFCGSIEPRKNLLRLLKAFLALSRQANPVQQRLVIITGGGWQHVEIDALIAANADRITVLRSIDEKRKAGVLQHADFLVQPSLYEGFGLPVVEALKCGLPILAADRGALPEVAGDAALLVDPVDDIALRGALARLCTDEPLRQRLATNARQQAVRFDWRTTAAATQRVLEEAADA